MIRAGGRPGEAASRKAVPSSPVEVRPVSRSLPGCGAGGVGALREPLLVAPPRAAVMPTESFWAGNCWVNERAVVPRANVGNLINATRLNGPYYPPPAVADHKGRNKTPRPLRPLIPLKPRFTKWPVTSGVSVRPSNSLTFRGRFHSGCAESY